MVASVFKLSAQSMSDVNYWVGDGQNQTMLVVNWTYADAVIAFGYRWDDSDAHYVSDMLAAFSDSIPNFNAVNSGGFIDDIEYTDEAI